ncbi:MAG TPA: hypothetical protein VGG58_07140 [Candidatus Acidoferrum sp.]|jgi:hypothetical protein
MKRLHGVLLAAACCLCLSSATVAQLGGMNMFSKPNIADIFRPVVGSGAVYEMQSTDNKNDPPRQLEMSVVGKEMTPTGEAYWMEMGYADHHDNSKMMYSKMLVTKDFEFTKIIIQVPGQGAMEMPFDSKDMGKDKIKDQLNDWSKVGSETVTVPAGTFSCAHWKKNDGTDEVWVSDKVTPMSMVKQVGQKNTMVLVKQTTGVTDHITGPVTPFNPKAFAEARRGQKQ